MLLLYAQYVDRYPIILLINNWLPLSSFKVVSTSTGRRFGSRVPKTKFPRVNCPSSCIHESYENVPIYVQNQSHGKRCVSVLYILFVQTNENYDACHRGQVERNKITFSRAGGTRTVFYQHFNTSNPFAVTYLMMKRGHILPHPV